jgi:ankyrin repeat protein
MGAEEPMLRWFVAHGMDINVVSDMDGSTPLYGAVRFARKERVALLLSLGARVNSDIILECCRRYRYYQEEDPEGSGDWDMLDIFRQLVPHMDMRAFSCYGLTPLMWLVSEVWGRADILALMLKAGADVNQRDTEGHTALWWAERPHFGDPCQEYVAALRGR